MIKDEYARVFQVGGIWRAVDGYEHHPAVRMTWYGAEAYSCWAGRKLPTEAHWEKAARDPDGRKHPWGNEQPNANYLNYQYNIGNTTIVGSFPEGSSPYGAVVMAGNVWEWMADWYDEKH